MMRHLQHKPQILSTSAQSADSISDQTSDSSDSVSEDITQNRRAELFSITCRSWDCISAAHIIPLNSSEKEEKRFPLLKTITHPKRRAVSAVVCLRYLFGKILKKKWIF
jgi:hypothetical protein